MFDDHCVAERRRRAVSSAARTHVQTQPSSSRNTLRAMHTAVSTGIAICTAKLSPHSFLFSSQNSSTSQVPTNKHHACIELLFKWRYDNPQKEKRWYDGRRKEKRMLQGWTQWTKTGARQVGWWLLEAHKKNLPRSTRRRVTTWLSE